MQSSTDHLSHLSYYGYEYSRKRRPVPGGASMSYLVQVQRGSTDSAASFDAETGRSRPRRETHFSAKLVVDSFHRCNRLAR